MPISIVDTSFRNFYMPFRHSIFLCTYLFLLTGCALIAPADRDAQKELPAAIPSQYMSTSVVVDTVQSASTPWWEKFESADLNKLMGKSLGENFDILTAWAKLRQSKALASRETAEFFPQININADAATLRTSKQLTDNSSRQEALSESYGLGGTASYELDFWGRINSERNAELLRAEATRNDLQTAAITVAGSVAETWAALLGNRAELAVLNEQISINEDLVQVQISRFNNGISTSLEVLQQQSVLASARAEIPLLEQQAVVLRNQLAVLQGTLPGTGLEIDENASLPTLGEMPEPGLPVQLLDARPDVNAAWARLEASDWDVSAAHANRYPSLRLTASHVFDAASQSLLFTNWISSLVGSLAFPLFDGGALAADEARARAETDINVQSYAKTVATAIQEVDNALAAEKGELENLKRLEEQYRLTIAALTEARNSYLGGVSDYLNFIVELKSLQTLQRTIAKQKTAVVQARITLYRTLGSLHFPLNSTYVPTPESANNSTITKD